MLVGFMRDEEANSGDGSGSADDYRDHLTFAGADVPAGLRENRQREKQTKSQCSGCMKQGWKIHTGISFLVSIIYLRRQFARKGNDFCMGKLTTG